MTALTIYHNPRCSKSRQTLQLLQDAKADVTIIEYLKTPPSKDELQHILDLLAVEPRQLMRVKESEYKELNLDNVNLSKEQLIEAMIVTPKLIERPIVVSKTKACIGRPPENALALI